MGIACGLSAADPSQGPEGGARDGGAPGGGAAQYALVAYIQGRLGEFLYDLRQEIVPSCMLRSHVSVLPPRLLRGSEAEALAQIVQTAGSHPAFEAKLGDIQVFPISNVIYIGLSTGQADLHAMYRDFNGGPLAFQESFAYHPHITLAQQLPPERQAAALALCELRWREYTGPRSFEVETLTFVKNDGACWIDLAETRLAMAAAGR